MTGSYCVYCHSTFDDIPELYDHIRECELTAVGRVR